MKRNDLIEIRQLDLVGLLKKAGGLKKEITSLVMDKNMRKMKDLKSISKKRKDLAQVLTVAKQKQMLEELNKTEKESKVEKKEEKVSS